MHLYGYRLYDVPIDAPSSRLHDTMCEADAHLNSEQLVQVLMEEILDQAAILLFVFVRMALAEIFRVENGCLDS